MVNVNSTMNTVDAPVINNRIMIADKDTVQVIPQVKLSIQTAYKVLKDKKAGDKDKDNAKSVIRAVHMADNNAYYSSQLMQLGKKSTCEAAYIDNALTKYIASADVATPIPDLATYYKILPDFVKNMYNKKARARLLDMYGYEFSEKELQAMESNGTLFIYEYLCSGVAYCVSTKTGSDGETKCTRTLVTRNLQLVSSLMGSGCVVMDKKQSMGVDVSAWVDTMEQNLFGPTAMKNLYDKKITVLNIKPESITKRGTQYSITKRQSAIDLNALKSADYKLYPIEACSILGKILTQACTGSIVAVHLKKTDGGTKTIRVTNSKSVVETVYPMAVEESTTIAEIFDTVGLIGWNAANMNIGLYRLDKEDFTLANIYPETITAIEVLKSVQRSGIDSIAESYAHTSDNWRDCMAARMIFNTTVGSLKKNQFEVFEGIVPGISDVVLRKDKKSVVLSWAISLSDEDLYDIMNTSLKSIFPDLKAACVSRRRNMPVYFKHFTPVQMPEQSTETAVTNIYKGCMQNGVLKVLYVTKMGTFKHVLLTNNPRVLMRTYGKGYVGEWETLSVRLTEAYNAIKAQEQDATIEINVRRILDFYDVSAVLFPDGFTGEAVKENNDGTITLKGAVVKQMLQQKIEELKEQKAGNFNSNGTYSEGKITGRVADGIGLEAQGGKVSFYRSLSLRTILGAYFAPASKVK